MADFDTFMKDNGLTGAALWNSGDENDSGEITFEDTLEGDDDAYVDENTFVDEDDEDEDEGDFIPESLRAFLRDAKATLQNEQLSLQAHLLDTPTSGGSGDDAEITATTPMGTSYDAPTPFQEGTPEMLEDSDDMLLKQQLLYGMNDRDSMLFGSEGGSKANTLDLDQHSFGTAPSHQEGMVVEGFVDRSSNLDSLTKVSTEFGTKSSAGTSRTTMMTEISPMASPIVTLSKGVDISTQRGGSGSIIMPTPPPEMNRVKESSSSPMRYRQASTGERSVPASMGGKMKSERSPRASPPSIVVPKQVIPPLKPISPRISPNQPRVPVVLKNEKPFASPMERPRMVTESPQQTEAKKPGSEVKSVLRTTQDEGRSRQMKKVVVTSPKMEVNTTPSPTTASMPRRNTPAPESMEIKVSFESPEATMGADSTMLGAAVRTPLPPDSEEHERRLPRRNTPAPKTMQFEEQHVQFDNVPLTPATDEHRHMARRRNTPAPDTFAVQMPSVTFDEDAEMTTPSAGDDKMARRNTPAPKSLQMHVGFEQTAMPSISGDESHHRSMPRRNTPAPKALSSSSMTEPHVSIGETPRAHLPGEEAKMPRRSTPAPRTLKYDENKKVVVIQTPPEALKTPSDHAKRLPRRATPAPQTLELSAEKMGMMPSPIAPVASPGMSIVEPVDENSEFLSPNVTSKPSTRQKSFWDRLSTPRSGTGSSSKTKKSPSQEGRKKSSAVEKATVGSRQEGESSAGKKSTRMSFSRSNKKISPMPTSGGCTGSSAAASRSIDAAKKARERVMQRKREEAAEQARLAKERLAKANETKKPSVTQSARTSSLRQSNSTVTAAQIRARERVQQRQEAARLASPPATKSRGSNVSVERAQALARQRVLEIKKKLSTAGSTPSSKMSSLKTSAPISKPPPLDISSPPAPGSTAVTSGRKSISAEEGQKRARERVRQRQLAASATSSSTIRRRPTVSSSAKTVPKSPALATKSSLGTKKYSSTGKPETRYSLDPNPITRAFGSPTHGYQAAPLPPPTEKPKLTVPKGPKLSTTARHGDKPPPEVGEKKVETPVPLNEKPKLTVPKAPRLSMSARLGDKPTPNVTTKKPEAVPVTKRANGLTVPKAPRLSTSMKYGKKATPSVHDEKKKVEESKFDSRPKTTVPVPFRLSHTKSPSVGTPQTKRQSSLAERMVDYQKHIREESPASATHEKPKLTKPIPFHLSTSNAPPVPPSQSAEKSCLAESVLNYQKHVRDAPPPLPVKRDMSKPTVARAPKFAPHPKRDAPKSSEEKEKEIMDYFKSHPFKANPLPKSTTSAPRRPKVVKKPLTTPVAPKVSGLQRKASKSKNDVDKVDEKRQFQARPMPNLNYRGPPPTKKASQKLTTPKPFQLSSERVSAKSKPKPTDEVEITKKFKARPLPITTFVPPKAPPARQSLLPSSMERPRNREPKLQSAAQAEKRQARKEAHEKHAEMVLQQKKESERRMRAQRHESEIPKVKPQSFIPTTPEPFNLQTEVRHEASKHRFEEEMEMKLKEEEEARRFVAQPMKVSPAPPRRIKTPVAITQPKPFVLATDQRHNQKQQHQQHPVEEEVAEVRVPKARPVPQGIYEFKPMTPKAKKKLVEPSSPKLESDKRARARQEFDAKVEAERQAELARKQELEARQRMEAEQELMEKRRLPVSEGGMMHVPLPIMGRPGVKATPTQTVED